MKPIIGVMPLWDDKKETLRMIDEYLNGITMFGGIPIIFPFISDENEIEQLVDMCDGLLFTGGHDVSPSIYNEEVKYDSVLCSSKRDALEVPAIKYALKKHKSVLGICRGAQIINACLGGKLYQDLPSEIDSKIIHSQEKPYSNYSHKIIIEHDSPLYDILKADEIEVNSLHHQAVSTLAPGLKCLAKAPDNVIEGYYKPDEKFFMALQWHPELTLDNDDYSKKIFKAFIDSMK